MIGAAMKRSCPKQGFAWTSGSRALLGGGPRGPKVSPPGRKLMAVNFDWGLLGVGGDLCSTISTHCFLSFLSAPFLRLAFKGGQLGHFLGPLLRRLGRRRQCPFSRQVYSGHSVHSPISPFSTSGAGRAGGFWARWLWGQR